MNTFDTGLSYIKAPFIGCVALFGIGAVLVDVSARFDLSHTITGLIGFSLLGATLVMPNRLARITRFIFSISDDAGKSAQAGDEIVHFQNLLAHSMAPSAEAPAENSATCSEGQENGDDTNLRSIV